MSFWTLCSADVREARRHFDGCALGPALLEEDFALFLKQLWLNLGRQKAAYASQFLGGVVQRTHENGGHCGREGVVVP